MPAIFTIIVLALTTWACLEVTRRRLDLRTPWAVPYEIAARVGPHRTRPLSKLQKSIIRRVLESNEKLLSGRVLERQITVRLNPDDVERLKHSLDGRSISLSVLKTVRAKAAEKKISIPAGSPDILIATDPRIHRGYVPHTQRLLPGEFDNSARDNDDHTDGGGGSVTVRAYGSGDTQQFGSPAKIQLTCVQSKETLTFHEGRFIAGRARRAKFRIDSTSASREHARFEHSLSGWTIQDLGSLNGTRVNGARLDSLPQSINEGDIIEFGSKGAQYAVVAVS